MSIFSHMQAIIAATLYYFAMSCHANTPIIVGDNHPICILNYDTSEISPVSTLLGTMFTITHPSATYIALHFSDISLVPASSLEISDASGEQSYILRG